MQIDDDIDEGKDFMCQVVCHDVADCPVGISGEAAIQVLTIDGREAGGCFGCRNVNGGDENNTSRNLFQIERFHQFHDGNLSRVFIAMIACHQKHGGTFAVCDCRNGNLQLRPTTQIIGERNIQSAP